MRNVSSYTWSPNPHKTMITFIATLISKRLIGKYTNYTYKTHIQGVPEKASHFHTEITLQILGQEARFRYV